MNYAPHLLPKIRSEKVKQAIGGRLGHSGPFPCTARIASFVPGHRCSGRDTVVPCHFTAPNRGVATKASDFPIIAGCHACHDLLDGRDPRIWEIIETHPAAFVKRLLQAVQETTALLIMAGVVEVKGGRLV